MQKGLILFFVLILFSSIDKLSAQISLDYSVTYQKIEGFGGFGPKQVWWSNTSQYYDEEYMDLIINDLGVNIIRTQLYWDFETSNDNDDPYSINFSGFNFSENSNNGKQFSFMMDLDTVPEMKQIASIWTPPIWMKLDVDNSLASFCNGQCGGYLNPDLYEEFAEYCVAYVKTIKNETGVDLYGLSLQNELLFANPFESCVYTPAQYAEVLKVVGKRFSDEGLDTKIFGPEYMGSYGGNRELFEEVLDDPEARKYLDIYAVHGYLDGVSPATGNPTGWIQMDERVREHGKQLWMTETSGGEGEWNSDFNMGYSLMLSLKYGKINAWVYWYLSGRIMENNVPQKLYYIFKNFYKYIRPGALMLECKSEDTDIIPVAFRNEKKGILTLVLLNNSDNDMNVPLNFEIPESVSFYRTSENENFLSTDPLSGSEIYLPKRSFTTMVAFTENIAPTINSVRDTVVLSDEGIVEIPLSGITNGGDGISVISDIVLEFEDPSIVLNPELIRIEDHDSAVFRFETSPESYGQTQVNITVNESFGAENGAFNSSKTTNFQLKLIPYINKPPTLDTPEGEFSYEKLSGDQFIKLTGITDGNTNDGRETLSFDINAAQKLCKLLKVHYNQGEDTALIEFSPTYIGEDTLELTLYDDFGTDLGGWDRVELKIPVTIVPRTTGYDFDPSNNIKIYPNPAGDHFYITGSGTKPEKVSVLDISGRILLSQQLNMNQEVHRINIKEISPGTYIVLVSGNKGELKRFLIRN